MDWQSMQHGKPFLTVADVPELVKSQFGLTCKKVKQLDCYDNQNFYIEVENDQPMTEKNGTKFVYKLMNHVFSMQKEAMINCTEVLRFLSEKGFRCPVPMKSVDGNIYQFNRMKKGENGGVVVGGADGEVFMFRLLTFLPGITLNQVDEVSDCVFTQAGQYMANMHNALENFDMSRLDHVKKWTEEFPWSLLICGNMKGHLKFVEDESRQKLAKEVLERFEKEVLPRKSELKHGILHGDFNDLNMLINAPQPGSTEHVQNIQGVIDFDDYVYAPLVFDVGVSIMYMMQAKTKDPLKAGGLFLNAYNSVRKLNDLEKELVLLCTCARFAQSLLGGLYSYQFSKDPYSLTTQLRGWTALELLFKKDWDLLHKEWEELNSSL